MEKSIESEMRRPYGWTFEMCLSMVFVFVSFRFVFVWIEVNESHVTVWNKRYRYSDGVKCHRCVFLVDDRLIKRCFGWRGELNGKPKICRFSCSKYVQNKSRKFPSRLQIFLEFGKKLPPEVFLVSEMIPKNSENISPIQALRSTLKIHNTSLCSALLHHPDDFLFYKTPSISRIAEQPLHLQFPTNIPPNLHEIINFHSINRTCRQANK